jgi:hypothetical protein
MEARHLVSAIYSALEHGKCLFLGCSSLTLGTLLQVQLKSVDVKLITIMRVSFTPSILCSSSSPSSQQYMSIHNIIINAAIQGAQQSASVVFATIVL